MHRHAGLPATQIAYSFVSESLWRGCQQLVKWFKQESGKDVSSREKPMLTEELKVQQRQWVKEYGDILTDKEAFVCFLDKKQYYKENRQWVLKEMPLIPGKDAAKYCAPQPKAMSRQFLNKIMYMRIVARPHDEYHFDSKINLIHVARDCDCQKKMFNEQFILDMGLIMQLKNHEWHNLYINNFMIEQFHHVMVEEYLTEDVVVDRLIFHGGTYQGKDTTTTIPKFQTARRLKISSTAQMLTRQREKNSPFIR